MEILLGFVRDMLQKDDSLSHLGNCRDSVSKIKNALIGEFPNTETQVLVYPEAKEGDGVHYSLLVRKNGHESVINVVKAPGFPVYIGDSQKAPPTFKIMKEAASVV